jgi:hypothetical protein
MRSFGRLQAVVTEAQAGVDALDLACCRTASVQRT